MKCKYCNSDNLILEKRSKDNKHILDAQQVALICGECGKYIKWCPKDERKFYWIKMIAPSPTKAKIELNNNSKDKQIAELKQQLAEKCDEVEKVEQHYLKQREYYTKEFNEVIDNLKQQLAEKGQEVETLKAKLETAEYWNKKYDDCQQQLEEKKKEIEKLKTILTMQVIQVSEEQRLSLINTNCVQYNQNQIAIEQLEKVKEFFLEEHRDEEMDTDYIITKDAGEIADYLLDQIKQLKEGK